MWKGKQDKVWFKDNKGGRKKIEAVIMRLPADGESLKDIVC